MLFSSLTLLCASCALPQQQALDAARCSVTDGDTIRCGDERIRLLGIDAPETAGHCRKGRVCVAGDPDAATRSLRAAMQGQPLSIIRASEDRYGRTLAIVYAGRVNLSCHQIATGHAEYVQRWDYGRGVARDCPAVRNN